MVVAYYTQLSARGPTDTTVFMSPLILLAETTSFLQNAVGTIYFKLSFQFPGWGSKKFLYHGIAAKLWNLHTTKCFCINLVSINLLYLNIFAGTFFFKNKLNLAIADLRFLKKLSSKTRVYTLVLLLNCVFIHQKNQ